MTRTRLFLAIIVFFAALLRFTNLSYLPPSLYWDEASIGYNAFSILTNGTDEHGVHFPLTHFLAYGDAKPPLYIYATSVTMAIFGVNDFSVRFPSALSGTLAIWVTYLLVRTITEQNLKPLKKLLFTNTQLITILPLLTSCLLAISPWHILLSRAGFEANLALTLFLAATYLFLQGLNKPSRLILAAVLYVSTLYTFNAYRIFLPIFLLVLGIAYQRQLIKHATYSLAGIMLATILIVPLVPFALSAQAQLRFNEVTIFNNHQPILEANDRMKLNHNTLWSKLIYNRRILFGLEFLRHYTDHFKPDFLFFSGDVNPRFSTRDIGQMYLIELPLIIIGIYLLARTRSKLAVFITAWIILAIIPAATARETPHALRTLQLLPAPHFLASLGILYLISKHRRLLPLLAVLYIFSLVNFLDIYYYHYPRQWANSWQDGYHQLVDYLADHYQQYDRVYITNYLGRPHTYLLFYLKYPVTQYLQTRDAGGDAFGFTYTNSFDKFYFTPAPESPPPDQSLLLVTAPKGTPGYSSQLKTIVDHSGNPVFVISEYSSHF